MPEGDSIFRAARTLDRALSGAAIDRFESVFPALTRAATDRPIVGRTVESVTARGKHLLMAFSGDLLLHTHMRMHGSWHIYRPGERWQRPARDMRIVVGTGKYVAVGFDVPVAEILTRRDLARHPTLQALGPDLLDPAFDRAEAARRIRADDGGTIADVLLDQRVMAGVGNVFKSEILFVAGVAPSASAADLDDETVRRIIDVARAQLRSNVGDARSRLAPRGGRWTTGSLHPEKGLWVSGRGGQPCRRCGTTIQRSKTGPDARITYWCPRCQP